MKEIFRGKSDKDCREHMELSARIDALAQEIRELKCDGHVWEPYGVSVQPVRCTKCGTRAALSFEEWEETKLKQAQVEFERLGGKVAEDIKEKK